MMPWNVASMFLRALVQDAHPDHIPNKMIAEQSDITYSKKAALSQTATESLQSTYRNIATSERKP